MTKEELKQLICSSKNRSGYYTRESTWKTLFPELYNDLQSWVFSDEFTFKQKVYHFINDDPDFLLGRCSVCGKRCSFQNTIIGYGHFCSMKCANNSSSVKLKKEQSFLKRYGVGNPLQSEEVREKSKQTCLEKYGVEHYSQTDEYVEKFKETCLDRYGVEYPLQSEEVREKSKETCLDKYGVEHISQSEEIKEKKKETCLERYGVENPLQSKEIYEKQKQTCLEKYGTESYSQTDEYKEKFKETCLEKYGVENPFQNKEIHEKQKQTCLDRYGVEHISQSEEIKEKKKETCLEKYGVEHYSQTDEYKEKSYQTKKTNNSFNSSKIEDQLKEYFDQNNINYIHQYKSDLYPFSCDFYFPEYDLYVEIQGSWTHGHHPFTGSEEDMNTLESWRSKGTKYYDNAISVWSVGDVKKRETAKRNNLNWIEIFSCDLDVCLCEIKNELALS